MAHSLAGIGVQARLAEELVGSDADEAKRSIRSIITATATAMSQLRETVGDLRSAPPPPPGLEDITAGLSGIDVDLVETGQAPMAGEAIEAVVRAIVREALTNVVRHSSASRARVAVHRQPDLVSVQICDDGAGGAFTEGTGIRGMRERVSALGGSLEATATADGFTVHAKIPI